MKTTNGVKTKQKVLVSFLLVFFMIFLSGCGCKPTAQTKYAIELEVWGLFDDSDVYSDIFNLYTSYVDTNVIKINYRKFTPDTYKKELVDALATGQGPDVFLIHNTWLPVFGDKIVPAPTQILDEKRFKENFVDVVADDFLYQGQAYAAPLSVNTLALFYNKDLLNEAGIVSPPSTWEEFVNDSKKITRIAGGNKITRSGAIMGTAYNINRPTDIVSVLMLQGGTQMVDLSKKIATFDNIVRSGDQDVSAGENALDFYTQFAKNTSSMYSWNADSHYSLDAFSEGWAAMTLNYSWNIATIQAKSPNLNFSVAPLPQLEGNQVVNYANYWAFAVSKNKTVDVAYAKTKNLTQVSNETRTAEAWKLISFLTTKPVGTLLDVAKQKNVIPADYDPTIKYLAKTYNPAARRDLIEMEKNDPRVGVFATQNLTAKSWYQADPEAVEAIFMNMIDEVNKGKSTIREAIRAAGARVTQLMQK
jgi:multiple sugar transport system substrate-binding protein